MMRGRMGGMISSAVTAVALLYATDTHSLPHWVSIGVNLQVDISLSSPGVKGGGAADTKYFKEKLWL